MDFSLIRVIGVLFGFACCVPVSSTGQNIVLGVLEDHAGVYVGDPYFRAVRIVFKKSGPDWQLFLDDCPDQNCLKKTASGYPADMTWTIAFDGKNLGQITSRTPKEFENYSRVGQEEITSAGPVPTVGERSTEFAGMIAAPVYRPLVANSQPYFRDPDVWRPAQLPGRLVTLLREQFRKNFPTAENCVDSDEGVPKPWPYTDDDIRVLKSYSSRNGWSMSRLKLEPYSCDGPADDPFLDHWFAISPHQDVQLLGSGMWLVDAGDYDNDGKSELLFSVDRYDRGGYELFYDDFRKHVTFEFSYH